MEIKKLFSTLAVLASIVGLLYLVYNLVCNHCCYDDDEDLYSEEFDGDGCGCHDEDGEGCSCTTATPLPEDDEDDDSQ